MKSATSWILTPGRSLPSDFASSSQEARRSEKCVNPSMIRPLIAAADGLFAADNWAIPFVRLGLAPPRAPCQSAAKALSLLTGGDEYVADAVARAQGEMQTAPEVRAAIGRARDRVEGLLPAHRSEPAEPGELEALGSLWDQMWVEIEAVLPPEVREKVRGSALR